MSDTDSKAPRGSLGAAVQAHLGAQLRDLYGDPSENKLPLGLRLLARRVAQTIRAHTEPVDQAFMDGIMDNLAPLRAYAISLTKAVDRAEDLVQDTVLRALSRQESFEAGTNLQAWLFTILRNSFFTEHRRAAREIEDVDGRLAGAMTTSADQDSRLVLQELAAALARLPQEQREALLLVAMEGLSYEETAAALGCAVGTVKSRVNRARNRLAEMLDLEADDRGGNRMR
ncbi:sigma-70 family RNA polymerase sigma factor [Microvirga sp. VF16]|uniref:sigma-70 family RNA polymerase sigma factor n=1 Tax=Microvirga sp. VF16 TaxID=2807101 RepID=UPI00193CA6F1|nr:sigma-70 family RNA polymerase sigma factor [Microvirga sp. VF16]QRM34441.1 sigma-70 family RNA polymerase sigma factor [Microvirga sp. VF16]